MDAILWALRRGYSGDPECGRTSNRIHVAYQLLRDQGIEVTITHAYRDGEWVPDGSGGPPPPEWARRGATHRCSDRCIAAWPEWVSDSVLEAAARMACELQDARRRRTNDALNERQRSS